MNEAYLSQFEKKIASITTLDEVDESLVNEITEVVSFILNNKNDDVYVGLTEKLIQLNVIKKIEGYQDTFRLEAITIL